MEVAYLLICLLSELTNEELNKALQNEEDNEDEDQLGQLLSEKANDVVVPVTLKNIENAFILRSRGHKEHDDGVSLSLGALETACVRCDRRDKGACMTASRVAILRTVLVVSIFAGAGSGQVRQEPGSISSPSSKNNPSLPSLDRSDSMGADSLNARMQEQQLRSRNSDRQKRLVSDTDKLVTLVKELKEQVETPDKPLQPSDVGKKAEEIEKLAKSVKDRMKG